ncbi:DUF5677 domain-containing protein [Nocardioides sp.]|uniref:DUF5677 domain-containing protein n=1 Tax=Nocardioides sp. TaxID=35761 RepID=UPI003444B833
MYRLEKSAPEACALVARAIIETALVGAFLAITPDSSERFIKKQAKHSRRLRSRLLANSNEDVHDVLADAEFLAAPLDASLDGFRAAPDFSQIAQQLDMHPPFAEGSLATHLYEEAYAFLSNYVEHPTPLSLARHSRVQHFRLPRRRFAPHSPVDPRTLNHVAAPAIAALAGCVARGVGQPHEVLDQWAREALHADGGRWSGSPLRHETVTATLSGIGLDHRRANLLGLLISATGTSDELRKAPVAEQMIAVLELMDSGKSWRSLLALARHGRTARTALELECLGLEPADFERDAEVAMAALYLAYAGVWPVDRASLRKLVRTASKGAASVRPGAFNRTLAEHPPPIGLALARMRERRLHF